jgi:uncharacterized membrane protein (UPF0182 family)
LIRSGLHRVSGTSSAFGWGLFAVFGILTAAIVRGGFYILERVFGAEILKPRKIIVNQQPVDFSLGRFLRPASWIIALVFGIGFGLSLSSDWNAWVLYLHQPATTTTDPIFGKPIGFYLFTLPIYNEIASWLTIMAILLLAGTVAYAILSAVPDVSITEEKNTKLSGPGKRAYAVVSTALGVLLLIAAWRTILSRYDYLWTDHSSFSGVTYTEANYLLPGLMAVASRTCHRCRRAIRKRLYKEGRPIVLCRTRHSHSRVCCRRDSHSGVCSELRGQAE